VGLQAANSIFQNSKHTLPTYADELPGRQDSHADEL